MENSTRRDLKASVSIRRTFFLTSDVFGTMKYAGLDVGFWDWIQMTEAAPTLPVSPKLSDLICGKRPTMIYFKFWPLLKNGREPDLVLLVKTAVKA